MKTSILRLLFWAGVIGLSVVSVTPGEFLPHLGFNIWDKLQHVLAYAGVSVLGGLAYPAKKNIAAIFLGLVALGAALEVIQSFVPNRVPGFGDAIANAVGTGIGLFVERLVRLSLPKIRAY